jgi:hypothetical protein
MLLWTNPRPPHNLDHYPPAILFYGITHPAHESRRVGLGSLHLTIGFRQSQPLEKDA